MYWHNAVYKSLWGRHSGHHFLLLYCRPPNWGSGLRWTWRCTHCACWLAALSHRTSPWAKYPSVWQNAKSPGAHTAPAPPSLAFHYHIHSLSQSCRCVFIPHTQTCIKRTAKIWLPVCCVVAVDGGGVETVLFWPLAYSLFQPLFLSFKAHSHTKSWFILYFHFFFYESPMVFVWRQKSFPYSFRDSTGRMWNGIHHYTGGSSFPSSAPSLWMGND